MDGSAPVEITSNSEPKITSVMWPASAQSESRAYTQIVVGSQNGTETSLYRVDLDSGKLDPMAMPSARADLALYDPHRRQAVFTANTRDVSYLWLVRPDWSARTIVETNTFLRRIAEGEAKKIAYHGLDGQDLKAWLILPPDYQPGKRYPMVAWVYPGFMAGEKPNTLQANLNYANALNLQLLAARGYIVLLPSMPLKAEGASDSYMELTKGALPGVD